MPAEKTSFC